MSETVKGEADANAAAAGPALTITDIHAQLLALRKAGMLSPEGCRMLAQAEAIEEAKRGMAEVQARLEKRLSEIEAGAARGRPKKEGLSQFCAKILGTLYPCPTSRCAGKHARP